MKSLVLMLLLVPISYSWAQSSSRAIQNMEMFDGFCSQNYESFDVINEQVKLYTHKAIPEGDPMWQMMGGPSFFVKHKDNNYIVGYKEDGGCGVYSQDIAQPELEKMVIENFGAVKVHSDPSGSQIMDMYKVQASSIHKGAIISITYAREEFGSDGTISYLPERLAPK